MILFLCAQAILFFIADLETVSSAMSLLVYVLLVNPYVQEKLYQDLRDNEAKSYGKLDYNFILSMFYSLNRVVSGKGMKNNFLL